MSAAGESLQLGIETLIAIDEDSMETFEHIVMALSMAPTTMLSMQIAGLINLHMQNRQQLVTDAKRSQRLA